MNSQPKGQFKLPPPKFRKKLSIPLKPKPVQTLLGGSILSSLATKVIEPDPTPSHFSPENLPEGIELLSSNLYVGFQCMYCDAKLTSEAIVKRHIDGTEHQKKLLLKRISGKKDPEKTFTPPKSILAEYLRDTSQPIVGLDFVAETQLPNTQPTFDCKMCGVTCNTNEIKEHIVGVRHCLMYLQMVESKKIEEIRSQFRKKSERNQEILKFAAQVEQERGRGTVKLILPEMANKEPSKETDSQDGKEKKDAAHRSVKRTIEELPSSSRKKLLLSSEAHDYKSNENTKYHFSNYPNTKEHYEDQDKELLKHEKKRSRWGGHADPSALSTTPLLPSSSLDVIVNTDPLVKESHSSSAVKTVRKTSLLKPQPKKPLYKPPRSYLLPSDIIKSQIVPSKPSYMQAAPPTTLFMPQQQSHKPVASSRNATSPTPRRHSRFDSVIDAKPLMASQPKMRLNLPKPEVKKEASEYHSKLTSVGNEEKPVVSKYQSQSNSFKTKGIATVANHKKLSNLSTNAEMPPPSQHHLKRRISTAAPHPQTPAKSVSEQLIADILKHTELKGGNVDIAALKHLCSFIICDENAAENVMQVINSLTQAYIQYKTRALTNPVRELLIQSLKDGGEGLQIILKQHGVNNLEPLDRSGGINNDTTRCASNVLRQFSSKWKEEPDDSSEKPNNSTEQDSDILIPNSGKPVTQKNEKSAFDPNTSFDGDSSIDDSSKLQQHLSNNWKEDKSLLFVKSSSVESFEDLNGLPLRSDKTNMLDR